jgi:hypothetical protein
MHNLYFVAYKQDIYVYLPSFPTQSVPEHPSLVIPSTPTSPGLRGHLDDRNPHAINNLIVQLLGSEEVVAVVRDDGDVDAFLIRHILQAVERRAEPESTIGVCADEVRPFFQSNVGRSAWGLAIHTESRTLATSSNASEVRVFRFGLLQNDDEDQGLNAHDNATTSQRDHNDVSGGRKRDVTHHVLNGQTNIPYIAFCNTGDDPDGRWLLTTDISGVCRVMDLAALRPVQAFRFGRSFVDPRSGGFDRINAGWAIFFMDRRSFKHEKSVHVAIGLNESDMLPGIHRSEAIWDLSKTVQSLPEASEPFVYHRTTSVDQKRTSSPVRQPALTHDSVFGRDADAISSDDDDSDGGAAVEVEIEMDENDEEDDDAQLEIDVDRDPDDNGNSLEMDHTSSDYTIEALPSDADESSNADMDSDSDPPVLVDDGEDPYDEGTEDSINFTSYYNGDSVCGNEPRYTNSLPSGEGFPPCPLLHASMRNVYLLQPPKPDATADGSAFVPPMVGIANPVRQCIQQDFEYLRVFERLNMSAYVPELGIVVLASQKGRAMVLLLSKLGKSTQYPPEMSGNAGKPNYCMRVAAILPFAYQEKANQRPFAPLHGIAVGPLQGNESVEPENRRWRLMMM